MTIFYTAPTAIRACMKWGAELPGQARPGTLRLLGTVGEPINPKAWLWYRKVIGGGRCPIVDTWWQTETGAIMITTLPGSPGDRSRARRARRCPGIERGGPRRGRQRGPDGDQGLLACASPWPSMLRTLYGDDDRYVETYCREVRQGDVLSSATPRAATPTATSGSSGASTTSSTSPATGCRPPRSSRRSSGTRGRRGGGDRPDDEDTRPVDRRVRDAAGRRATATTIWSAASASTSRSGSASSRGRSGSSGPTICRRRARARSCAGCCATSPKGASSAT